jgi:ParB family chromosome partitioning protein
MIQSIQLKKLAASPNNARKSSDPAADAQLKADIAARGLLQNLVVRKAARGKFEVEAGGRRLAALQALAADGAITPDQEVTCLVIEGEESEVREASLAENFQRLAMNPADEAQAFAAIIEAGASVEEVARRFGLTVRFVEGRLRLAALAPCIFEALAAGEITLDMAKAYGAISDTDRQAHPWQTWASQRPHAPNHCPQSAACVFFSWAYCGSTGSLDMKPWATHHLKMVFNRVQLRR